MGTLGFKAAKRIKETREFIAIVVGSCVVVGLFATTITFMRPIIAPQPPIPSISKVARVER